MKALELRCAKCGIAYSDIYYVNNHYRRIAAGMKCVEAYIFRPCDGVLEENLVDEKENDK